MIVYLLCTNFPVFQYVWHVYAFSVSEWQLHDMMTIDVEPFVKDADEKSPVMSDQWVSFLVKLHLITNENNNPLLLIYDFSLPPAFGPNIDFGNKDVYISVRHWVYQGMWVCQRPVAYGYTLRRDLKSLQTWILTTGPSLLKINKSLVAMALLHCQGDIADGTLFSFRKVSG